MIIEFTWFDVFTVIATGLSLAGNWYVIKLSIHEQTKGYWCWFISNILWVIYFMGTNQYGPLVLFMVYFLITLKALIDRSPSNLQDDVCGCGE